MRERDRSSDTFQFPSPRKRVALLSAAVLILAALPFVLPSLRRTASKVTAAWKYPEARDVVAQFAAAAALRDTSAIRRTTLSGSDSSTLCARAAWPAAVWQFRQPRPRVTFDGVQGDYLFFMVHSTAEQNVKEPVGLRVGVETAAPNRVAIFSPLPAMRDVRGC